VKGRSSLGAALAALALLAGCGGLSDEAAEKLVRAYHTRLVEAYRASDAEITAPVVGEEQARKLTGLIGVKRDAGVNMDARLLEVRFEHVERKGQEVLAITRERWHYRDLQIGSGEQAGQDSTDAYHLRYHLAHEKGRWVVARIEFVDPPEVGRATAAVPTDFRVLHGLPPRSEEPSPR
jgi:hypothetical protein